LNASHSLRACVRSFEPWSVEDIIALVEAGELKLTKRGPHKKRIAAFVDRSRDGRFKNFAAQAEFSMRKLIPEYPLAKLQSRDGQRHFAS
jgi:hypothetical protein